jgi:rhodanese-related sulfurtransferase
MAVTTEMHYQVTVGELRRNLDRGAAVRMLDVRSAAEFETARIPGACNVPLDQLGRFADELAGVDGELVVVCQSGARSNKARIRLSEAGAKSPRVLEGGMEAWQSAGGATEGGRCRWSLERQVRLVAGSLVLGGVLASLRWPPVRLLSGLVGAGLVFAAVTDSCMMGEVLARLPYNRGSRVDVEAAVSALSS